MHRVVVVAFDNVVAFDLATPSEALGRLRLPSGHPAYRVRVCGPAREVDAGAFTLHLRYGLSELKRADTVLVPGLGDVVGGVPEAVLIALRKAAAAGARIASICSGAFVLAAAGLLNGKRATTHWIAAEELARRFPKVNVDPNVLFVDEGQILTSAGASAGIDLCLHLVRRDYGAALAASAARLSVMPLERDGGQAQFIEHAPAPNEQVSLSRVLEWLAQNLEKELSLQVIAKRAAMSSRTLSRQFKAQVGITPLQWVLRARVRRAQELLETTPISVERVAESSGFGSVATFREHFHRVAGTSPVAYRRAFRGTH
jgi:transcriptional regulator GlxA family with amidase domain